MALFVGTPLKNSRPFEPTNHPIRIRKIIERTIHLHPLGSKAVNFQGIFFPYFFTECDESQKLCVCVLKPLDFFWLKSRKSRWWFQNMFFFHPENWGNDPI